jgi:glycogen operon protein
MLLGGEEIGRTQRGNNNAYCQDGEVSWYDWERGDEAMLGFVRSLVAFYRAHPVFRRQRWFQGRPIRGEGVQDVAWFRPDGREMTEDDWGAGFAKSLGVFLNGEAIPSPDREGHRVVDDSFLMLFNAHHEPLAFRLPGGAPGRHWQKVLDTADGPVREAASLGTGQDLLVEARSLVVLRRVG